MSEKIIKGMIKNFVLEHPKIFLKGNVEDLKLKICEMPYKGNWNFNFLLKINNRFIVAKVYPPLKSELWDNSGIMEFNILKFLDEYKVKIAPKPISLTKIDKERVALFYEYVPGDRLKRYSFFNLKKTSKDLCYITFS